MIYDELIEELALTLLTKARYEGCISVIDGFSQCEEDKTRIEYPMDRLVLSPRRRLLMRPPTAPVIRQLRNCRVRPRTPSTML